MKKEIIEILRQRSRPYLFSNSLAPSIVGASNKVFEILSATTELRDKLESNTSYFKEKIKNKYGQFTLNHCYKFHSVRHQVNFSGTPRSRAVTRIIPCASFYYLNKLLVITFSEVDNNNYYERKLS
jgi:7-keto-8-aminopelargonate synthetase-like enzyme